MDQRVSRPPANQNEGSPAPKKVAAQAGTRSGGKEKIVAQHPDHRTKGPAQASVKLAPAWNDDGHFSGWINLGDAAALVIENIGGRV